MISKIFLFVVLLCFSSYGFCQDSLGNKLPVTGGAIKAGTSDSMPGKSIKTDPPKTTSVSTISGPGSPNHTLTNSPKDTGHLSPVTKPLTGAVHSPATVKPPTVAEHHPAITNPSAGPDHKPATTKAPIAVDNATKITPPANEGDPPGTSETATSTKHHPATKARGDSNHQKVADKPLLVPVNTPVETGWPITSILLVTGIIILASATAFLFFKNRKMAIDRETRQKIIDNYSTNTSNLQKFLKDKGVIKEESDKHIRSIHSMIEELTDRYLNEEERSKQLNMEVEKLNNDIKLLALRQAVPVISATVPATYIKSEIILSAGPRKNTAGNDTEMGEDIAGLLTEPGKTYFWLLDGTSDNTVIKSLDVKAGEERYEEYHIFSSRLLAQSIGHFIQRNISAYGRDNVPLNELLANAGKQVSLEWEKKINAEPPEKKESILQAIKKGFKPICSTTAIIGCLTDDGRLYALRTGDSKVFPFKNSDNRLVLDKQFRFTADPTEESDRVAFRLDFDETSNAFVIKQNIPKFLNQAADDILSVLAFSDGIGRITEAQLASDNPGIVEMIRQHIGRIPQKTHDDKTLIILERISTIV